MSASNVRNIAVNAALKKPLSRGDVRALGVAYLDMERDLIELNMEFSRVLGELACREEPMSVRGEEPAE